MKIFEKCVQGLAATAAAFTLMFGANAQAGIIGVVQGPDNSFSIEMGFLNTVLVSPFSNVLSLSLNGGTALAGPIVWDDYWNVGGSSANPISVVGVDTSLLTFNWGQFGFLPTQTFSVTLDPDFAGQPSSGLYVADLVGVSVAVNYRNGSSFLGSFIDNPIRSAGLYLQSGLVSVPEPATLGLLGLGLLGLGAARRRKSVN